MKKILACTLALTMTAIMMTACGNSDDSSSKADTASSAAESAAEESSEAEESVAEESSEAEESAAEESSEEAGEGEGEEEGEAAKDISEMPATLKNYENASVYFSTDMDVTTIIEPFAEDKGSGAYTPNTDESHVELSIEELEGIPMIRVQVLDWNDDKEAYELPKIRINMATLFAGQEADLEKIFTVKADVVTKAVGNFVGDDGSEALVPGNFMGAFVTQPTTGDGGNSWNDLYDFGESEWVSEWGSYELVMRPGIKAGTATFVNSTDPQYVSIMRWSIPNQADFYIADLVFEDEDGNVIACANFAK